MAKNKYKEMIKIKSDISDLIRLGPKWDSGYIASRANREWFISSAFDRDFIFKKRY